MLIVSIFVKELKLFIRKEVDPEEFENFKVQTEADGDVVLASTEFFEEDDFIPFESWEIISPVLSKVLQEIGDFGISDDASPELLYLVSFSKLDKFQLLEKLVEVFVSRRMYETDIGIINSLSEEL